MRSIYIFNLENKLLGYHQRFFQKLFKHLDTSNHRKRNELWTWTFHHDRTYFRNEYFRKPTHLLFTIDMISLLPTNKSKNLYFREIFCFNQILRLQSSRSRPFCSVLRIPYGNQWWKKHFFLVHWSWQNGRIPVFFVLSCDASNT